jgi:hypothetical protein
MFKNRKPKPGLMVLVSETRYDMFGSPNSLRDLYLAGLLKANGGINHSVAPGIYTFNAHRRGFKTYMTLEPSEAQVV